MTNGQTGSESDCERNRDEHRQAEVLDQRRHEVEAAEEVDAEHAATKVQSPRSTSARGSREKMIARSPASSTSSPGNMARPSPHDRLDQRPRRRQVAEPLAREVAFGPDCDVENLEASCSSIATCFVRVAREADDLLGGDQPRVDRDVDARLLEDLHRDAVVDDRDRRLDAVQLRHRRGVVVLCVVAHREDCGIGASDVLLLEELGVCARGVEHPRLGDQLCDFLRAVRPRSINRTRISCWQRTRAVAVPICPAPKMTTSSTFRPGEEIGSTTGGCGEPITTILSLRTDRLLSTRHRDLFPADDAHNLGVGRICAWLRGRPTTSSNRRRGRLAACSAAS